VLLKKKFRERERERDRPHAAYRRVYWGPPKVIRVAKI
jgi:hypothetical protein